MHSSALSRFYPSLLVVIYFVGIDICLKTQILFCLPATVARRVIRHCRHDQKWWCSGKRISTACCRLPNDACFRATCIWRQALASGAPMEAVSMAIEEINSGNLGGALQLLDALLERSATSLPERERLGAYLSRGTARAMLAKESSQYKGPSRIIDTPANTSQILNLTHPLIQNKCTLHTLLPP